MPRRDVVFGNMMLAPAVVAMRMPLLAAEAARSSGIGTEATRAVTEKTAAMAEGIAAAQLSLIGSAITFWSDVARGRVPDLLSGKALEKSMDAALRPIGKRVRANHRRLSAP